MILVVSPGRTTRPSGCSASTLQLIQEGATHIGVASDHVIESFRNDLWAGYKTSEGMLPELLVQIPSMEEALVAMGVTTWAMVEWEADDALGAAAAVADADERVEQVLIVTPDKDLGQCVVGQRVVQYDRRKGEIIDEAGVIAKFGVGPASIPDYLGLVGDTADGFPGLPGWGAKSASSVLAGYDHLEQIPTHASLWEVAGLRGAAKLSATLQDKMELALLFREHRHGRSRRARWARSTIGSGTARPPSSPRCAIASASPALAKRTAAVAATALIPRRCQTGMRWLFLAEGELDQCDQAVLHVASVAGVALQHRHHGRHLDRFTDRWISCVRCPSNGFTAMMNGMPRASK